MPALRQSGKPRYVEIAEAIKRDIDAGVLSPGDRLPPQRGVAREVGLDFTTVSRGYAEAVKQGYIETFVGRGSFVRMSEKAEEQADPRRSQEEDPKMNMPPEPDDPELIARMQDGLAHVSANLVPLLRYQSPLGSVQDREIGARWMHANGLQVDVDRLVVTSGAHASLLAVLTLLCPHGATVLCERVTYPGIRALAAQRGLHLVGVETDESGVLADALEDAILTHSPSALYLNPTLQNPTTVTVPHQRRSQIAMVLRNHELALIEDDACRFVSSDAPPPISHLVPDLGWYIAGLSKCLGAGLRLAFTVLPSNTAKEPLSQVVHTSNVMACPVTTALASRWIADGTAGSIQNFVRKEARRRQALAAEILRGQRFKGSDEAFNIWLTLPDSISRAEVMGRMATRQIGVMPSDTFTVAGPPSNSMRVCLGGPISTRQLKEDLEALNHSIS